MFENRVTPTRIKPFLTCRVRCLQYEINRFNTSTTVEQSPRKFAHIFRQPKEESVERVDVPFYDIDCGSNKSLHKTMLGKAARSA